MNYEDFLRLLFGIIEEQLNYDPEDPLPDYSSENAEQLDKILTLIQNNNYYPSLVKKAAYLFVSINEGHIFSNGNKRLAYVTLLYFLLTNGCDLNLKPGELKELCLFVADKNRNKNMSFEQLKNYVEEFLQQRIIEIDDPATI